MKSRVIAFLSEHGSSIVLFTVLAGSLALNVVQARHLRTYTPPATRAKYAGPAVGELLSPLSVVALDGTKLAIAFNDPSTLVYVMAPDCSWCEQNRANIIALAAAQTPDTRVVGLSIKGPLAALSEHLKQSPLPFPVYLLDASDSSSAERFGFTPQTVMAVNGKVTHSWGGAMTDNLQAEVERTLKIRLPGITPLRGDKVQ